MASCAVQPKICVALAFQVTMWPSQIDADEGVGRRFENQMRERFAVSEALDGVEAHPKPPAAGRTRRPVL